MIPLRNSADEMVDAAVKKRQAHPQTAAVEAPDLASTSNFGPSFDRPNTVFRQRGFSEAFLSDGPFVHLLQAEQLIYSAMRKCDQSSRWGPLAYFLRGQTSIRSRSLGATSAIFAEIRHCARELQQWFVAVDQPSAGQTKPRVFCDFASLAEAESALENSVRKNEDHSKVGFPGRLWLREARLLKADWETFRHSVQSLRDFAKRFEMNRSELAGRTGYSLPNRPFIRQAVLGSVFASLSLVETGLRSCSGARAASAGFIGPIARLNRQLLEAKQLLVREWTSDLRALRPVFSTYLIRAELARLEATLGNLPHESRILFHRVGVLEDRLPQP